MRKSEIHKKFGDEYTANERTFMMGIDRRFTSHIAERFLGRYVLETCAGAGFSTISLAGVAAHVTTVEIEALHLEQARENIARADLQSKVTFISGNVLDEGLLKKIPSIDAAFLDPDWAVTGPDHVFRFLQSNTQPPADQLLARIQKLTGNIALILPPLIDKEELRNLEDHECESLYLNGNHELYCLYFGDLARVQGETHFSV
jgi:hypothetical protein